MEVTCANSDIGCFARRALIVVLMLLGLCAPVFGESDAIVVTVSRNVDLAPDALYYSLAVGTEPETSLDQVLEASKSLGLTAQDLVSVNSQQFGPSPNQTRLLYVFMLAVPIAKFKETNDKVAAVRRTMAAATPPMELQSYGIAISPAETARDEARAKLLTALLDDARARADQLAKAAGVTLGGVVGVSEAWAAPGGGYPYYGPYGPVGPSSLKTAFMLTVRYAVK